MIKAIAVLKNGIVRFEQKHTGGSTSINVEMKGLNPGKHGFHVHEYGDLSNGCISSGGHYNPFHNNHGGPTDNIRHMGDLGNITVDKDGNVNQTIIDDEITLIGKYSVVGRSIVVHADIDDLGKGNSPLSLTTGNSGDRIACGVIGIASSN